MERAGPLNDAQLRMWMRLGWRSSGGTYPVLRFTWKLPHPVPLAAAYAAWSHMVQRHEVLRTVFVESSAGTPLQVVLGVDHVGLPVSTADVASLTGYLHGPVRGPVVDAPHRPLWYARQFANEGLVETVVVTAEHMVTDGGGLIAWRNQFFAACAGDTEIPDGTISHPLDQPRVTTPDDATGAASRHQALVATAAQILVPPGDVPDEDRFLDTHVVYPSLLPTMDQACHLLRCSRSVLGLFIVAVLLAKFARSTSVFFETLFANRVEDDRSIDCRMVPAWLAVQLDPELTAREAVMSTYLETVRAFTSGRIQELDALELSARTAAQRGASPPLPIGYSFLGPSRPADPGSWPEERDEERLRPRITKEWGTGYLAYSNRFEFWVESAEDLEFGIDVDTAMFPEAVVEKLIRALPIVVDLLAQRPDATCGELDEATDIPLCATHGCERVGPDWIHRADQRRADRRHAALSPVQTLPPGPAAEPIAVAPALADLVAAFEETHGCVPVDLEVSYTGCGGRLLSAPTIAKILHRQGYRGLHARHFESDLSLSELAWILTR